VIALLLYGVVSTSADRQTTTEKDRKG
jgi:hypothetical protein